MSLHPNLAYVLIPACTKATKRTSMLEAPPTMVVQAKQFVFESSGERRGEKLKGRLRYFPYRYTYRYKYRYR